ncbi:hypothetical protein PR048_011752 [Dryococelus australis]|uniref:Uncharacterized protein n=1 Tax=Dryococelus australis TaxID=614101 RepID=A0ABQ9HMF3_9NEOP|nr:hypothetical protein PR048_011752 [Dryococelus australis]
MERHRTQRVVHRHRETSKRGRSTRCRLPQSREVDPGSRPSTGPTAAAPRRSTTYTKFVYKKALWPHSEAIPLAIANNSRKNMGEANIMIRIRDL